MFKLISLGNKEDIEGFDSEDAAIVFMAENGYTKDDYTIEEYESEEEAKYEEEMQLAHYWRTR